VKRLFQATADRNLPKPATDAPSGPLRVTTEDPTLGRRIPRLPAALSSPRAFLPGGWMRTRGLAAGLAAIFTVLAWPLVRLSPGPGLDPSHDAAMHMASRGGLQFGTQLLFTYGPLGFLASPVLYYGRTGLLAAGFVLAVEITTLYVFARSFLRALHPLAAFAAMWLVSVAVALGGSSELLALLVALLALEWIELAPASRRDPLVPAALAALGSMALLVKFSAGVVALAAVALACVLRNVHDGTGRRLDPGGAAVDLGSAAAGALGSLVVCWVAAGESLGHLVVFLRGSLEVASGYSAAMNIEDPARAWEYGAAALAVACLLIALPVSRRGRGLKERFALPAVIALVAFGMFKEGFTRHDLHSAAFFSALLVLSSALWGRVSRPVVLTLFAFLLSLSLAVNNLPISGVLALKDGPARARESVSILVSGSRRAGVETASRTELRARYGLSAPQLALLAGHTVHVDPWEASLAWAYPELRWDPAPVFQTYSAYTRYLDDLNAGFLASGRAPDFILRHADAIDGRDPRWESPRYMLEMLCRYRQVGSGSWQVLERVASRCGSPVASTPVRTTLGRTVSAPAAGAQSIVAMRVVSWSGSLGERLRTLLYKDDQYYLTYANGPTSRFVPGDAGSWHAVAVPSCLGWDPSAFPRTGTSLRFDLGQPPLPGAKPITVQFAAIPFACP
jgi:hypothetical protein